MTFHFYSIEDKYININALESNLLVKVRKIEGIGLEVRNESFFRNEFEIIDNTNEIHSTIGNTHGRNCI